MRLNAIKLLLLAVMLAGAGATTAQIKGAGSSFAQALYTQWAAQYLPAIGATLAYEPSGSSAGQKAAIERTADFGGSERPLSRDDLQKHGLAQFPVALGAVVIVANVQGLEVEKLLIDGPTLAEIYLKRITSWADPKIAALNPGMTLRDVPIVLVHRAEGSGTSFVFTSYLSKVSPAWKQSSGVTSQLSIAGAKAANGNKGVAETVKATPGAVGYVEYSFAKAAGLSSMRMRNLFGEQVGVSNESVQQAVRAVDWEILAISQEPTFELDLVNTGCPKCWPIVAPTFALVPYRGRGVANSANVFKFMDTALKEGDTIALREGYVPLPSRAKNMVKVAMNRWQTVLAK